MFKLELLNLKGNRIEVGTHSIYFETEKNSDKVERTFVISHGACGSGRYMTMIAEAILNEIPNSKVLIIDVPYHGESISTDSVVGKNVHDYANTVSEFLTVAKETGEIEGKLHWIGWSMGGSIGLLLDLDYGLLDEITMLNSSFVWHTITPLLSVIDSIEPNYAFFKQVLSSSLVGDVTEEFKAEFMANFENISAIPEVMANDFKALSTEVFDVTERLDQVKAKTLIFSGHGDDLATVENQGIMFEKIKNSSISLINDNHILLLKPTAVEAFIKAMKDFISK